MQSGTMYPMIGGPFHGKGYLKRPDGPCTIKVGGFGVEEAAEYRFVDNGVRSAWVINTMTDGEGLDSALDFYD